MSMEYIPNMMQIQTDVSAGKTPGCNEDGAVDGEGICDGEWM